MLSSPKEKNRIDRGQKRRVYSGSQTARLEDSDVMNEQIKKAVEFAIDAGYQLNSDAFVILESLSKSEDPVALMEETVKELDKLSQKPLFIDRAFLEDRLASATKKRTELTTTPLPEPPLESKRESFKPYAQEFDSD